MDLASIIDLEWLLRDEAALHAVDARRGNAAVARVAAERAIPAHELRSAIDTDASLRRDLAKAWLDEAREGVSDLPGDRVAHGLEVAGWILVALGLLLGASTAKALLAFDGKVPVNVLWFIFVLCVGQIALLLLMVAFVARGSKKRSSTRTSVLHRPIAALASRFFGDKGREFRSQLVALRARRGLLVDIERWTLFAVAQRFGLAFNLAALVVAFATIAFSSLTFSWSTTLDVDASTVHAAVRAIALPWFWLPSAIPSAEVVAASQWVRMPGAFVGANANVSRLAEQWWSFLIAGVLVWGFLPRLAALLFGVVRARLAITRQGFDHVGYQRLFDRLLPVDAAWHGPKPGDVVGPAPGGRAVTGRLAASVGAPTWTLLWGSIARQRDVVQKELEARFAAEVRGLYAVGGADLAADSRACADLTAAKATRVVLVASAGQQPTTDVLDLVRSVRAAIGFAKPIVVLLVDVAPQGGVSDAEEEERQQWSRSLGALEDAHVYVAARRGGA